MQLPAWIKAAALLGAPTVISLYLTYWVTNSISAQVREALELLQPHVAATTEMHRTMQMVVDIERVQCVNAASTDNERRACILAGSDR